MTPDEIGSRLRAGQYVADADFDEWLPDALRRASPQYWTQVGVALRVTRWLKERGVESVLDVGSGAGKLCVVGALSSGITFTGVEQREALVDAARELAERFGVSARASFVHGKLDVVDFRLYDALYFYNPFGENIFATSDRLDDSVEISRGRFERDVIKTEYLLGRMPVGTHLVTYNGYGGRLPDSFELEHAEATEINLLRLWRKARETDQGGYWLELEDSTMLRIPGRLELLSADQVGPGLKAND